MMTATNKLSIINEQRKINDTKYKYVSTEPHLWLILYGSPVVAFRSIFSGSQSLSEVASNIMSGQASPVAHLKMSLELG